MRQDQPLFEKRHTVIVSAGSENAADFRKYWENNDLPFMGIPDPEQKILKLYGQEVNLLKLGRMPAQFLIDSRGTLQMVHYGESMKDIVDDDPVLQKLDNLMSENP